MSDNVPQETQIIDETPISPIRPNQGRKNSLENHLQHRPERSELVESNEPPRALLAFHQIGFPS